MNGIRLKKDPHKESLKLSHQEIKKDYNPHRQSACAAFLRAYKPFFIKNFNKICNDTCTCDSCLSELNIEGEYLYDIMFNPDQDVCEDEVNSLFDKLIHHSAHDDVYKAYADHIDVQNRKVRFTSFISQDHESENRNHVRVNLAKITRAMIIGKQAEAEGIIYDISETACAIYVRNVKIINFETGSPVRFIARLPETSVDNSINIDTMATIYQSYKQGNNDMHAYRIVIHYNNEPAFFTGLANYVSSRQREIIRELKDLSNVTS